jgi:hypothetical protein
MSKTNDYTCFSPAIGILHSDEVSQTSAPSL